MTTFNREDRILALGESNSGKTYLAESIARQAQNILVFTPHEDEWAWVPEGRRIVGFSTEALLQTIQTALDEGNLVLVIDDSDILLKKTEKDPRLNYLLMGARHRGVGWIIISRRTTDLPTLVFKQANKVFIFQTDLPQDLDNFEAFYGCRDAVKQLDRANHQYLYIDREAQTQAPGIAE